MRGFYARFYLPFGLITNQTTSKYHLLNVKIIVKNLFIIHTELWRGRDVPVARCVVMTAIFDA